MLLYVGLPLKLVQKHQQVQNAAARLTVHMKTYPQSWHAFILVMNSTAVNSLRP